MAKRDELLARIDADIARLQAMRDYVTRAQDDPMLRLSGTGVQYGDGSTTFNTEKAPKRGRPSKPRGLPPVDGAANAEPTDPYKRGV